MPERAGGRLGGRTGFGRRQAQLGPLPAVRQLVLHLRPSTDETHGPETYTAVAVAKVEKRRALNDETLREFLREMLLIRRFEERVEERFRAGDLPGFLHVAIGEEATTSVSARPWQEGDVFASTHRAHGHTLARGTHPNAVMAELYGKIEGCSHGYGGSMHLYDVERGNLGANAVDRRRAARDDRRRARVQDARRAEGRGRVLRRRRDQHRHLPRVAEPRAAVEDEDGLRLPEQPLGRVDARLAALAGVGRHEQARAGLRHARGKVDGQDVEAVYEASRDALEFARSGEGPVFLDVETVRMHGHYIGDAQVYRTKEDREDAAKHDPIERLRSRLELTDEEFDALDDEVHEIVDAALEFAAERHRPAARRRAEERLCLR